MLQTGRKVLVVLALFMIFQMIQNVKANDDLIVDFFYDPVYPLSLEEIQFKDNSTYKGENVSNWPCQPIWDFGDGSICYEMNPTHAYKKPGRYNVTYTLILEDNGKYVNGTVTKQIIVQNRCPVAKFYWIKTNTTILFNASFSYDLDGSIVNYTWDFGDGSVAYGKVVTHAYAEDGTYNVTLTIKDDYGDVNQTYMEVNTLNKMPVANFDFSPKTPTDLEEVQFMDLSYDLDGYIDGYIWVFGDGNISYEQNPRHRYGDDGTYNVKQIVIDNGGSYAIITKQITVYNVGPTANFSWQPKYPFPGKNIIFNASFSYDLDGSIVNYTWDFGDGSVAYGKVVTHAYAEDGTYNVTLTIKDDDGAIATRVKRLFIADYYVDKNIFDPNNHTWNKIQDAIDNATDDSSIYIRSGIYNENVLIYKKLRIMGENATINGIINLTQNEILIKNLTIKNILHISSNNNLIKDCKINAHINIKGNENVIINNQINSENISIVISGNKNEILNNTIDALYGCKIEGNENYISNNSFSCVIFGIRLKGENNVIKRNLIKNCQYGIQLLNSATIENNIFDSNLYGLKIDNYSIIGKNIFKNNYDCGIFASRQFVITNSEFFDNKIAIWANEYAIIMGIVIDGGEYGIRISNGEIENSTIYNLSYGIEVNNNINLINCLINGNEYGLIGKAKINNCNFSENYIGISVEGSLINNSYFIGNVFAVNITNSSIYNCSFIRNGVGLKAQNSSISFSTFKNNDFAVFTLYATVFKNNTIEENNIGIQVEGSKNIFDNNKLLNNTYGMRILFSPSNTLYGNIFIGNKYNLNIEGSRLEHFYQKIDESNKINYKAIAYLINNSNKEYSGFYGYFALINCSNIHLENIEISNNGEGLLIVMSKNISINGKFIKNINGIYLLKGCNITLVVNSSYNENGISAKSVNDMEIYNSKFYGNIKGINVFNIERKEANIVIRNCSLDNNSLGINVENILELYVKNSTLFNEKNLRIFNSNISIYNCSLYGKNGIIIEFSYLDAKDCNLYCNYSINVSKSILYFTGMINNSLYGIVAHDSILYLKSKIISNEFGIMLENCSLSIDNSNLSKNYLNFINNSKIYINNTTFYQNTYAINVTNCQGKIENSTFYKNSYAIILYSPIPLYNITAGENTHGVVIYTMNNSIRNGEFYNNSNAIEIYQNGNEIDYILFHHNYNGILINSTNSKITNCTFWRNFYGIVAYGENNTIYHNNFIYNSKNAMEYGNNIWNASYPAGGNYWYDYAGRDYYKGKKQNESGSDGIGDIPYELNKNKDFYPLMEIYENASPMPNLAPIASFYFYPSTPYSFDEIIFIDTSYDENGNRDIINWTWDFGDGNISYEQVVKHSYKKPGTYNITLFVKDKAGLNSSYTLQIVVKNLPPSADFSWNPKDLRSYTVVTFNANLSKDLDGYIVNYTWDFGDGSVAYGEKVTHKYTKSGEYTVKLFVKDNNGEEGSAEYTIKVGNREPTANFIYAPEKPKAGEIINFTDLSNDLDGEIVEWKWEFGDGTISYDKNPSHTYNKPGIYIVNLTVKDNEGGRANYSIKIKIGRKETPSFGILLFTLAILIAILRKWKNFK